MPLLIKQIDNEKGLTLIEVLVSLILLSLLSISTIRLFTSAASWSGKAQRETIASNYAAALLEDLRSDRSKIIEDNSGSTAQDLFPGCGYPWAEMSAVVTRIKQQSAPYNNLYDITVTVSWLEGTETRVLHLNTIIKKD